MNIRRAGRKVVKNLHKGYGIYRIGFVNIYGEEDETELDAMNINDLERKAAARGLWMGNLGRGQPASGDADRRSTAAQLHFLSEWSKL